MKQHPLMEDAVPNFFEGPVFLQIGQKEKFTQIAVDIVFDVGGRRYDVLFVGTDRGSVLKIVNIAGKKMKSGRVSGSG